MRPHRVRLTTNLVNGYGLTDKMRLLRPAPRTREQIMEFHADGKYACVHRGQYSLQQCSASSQYLVPSPAGQFCFGSMWGDVVANQPLSALLSSFCRLRGLPDQCHPRESGRVYDANEAFQFGPCG